MLADLQSVESAALAISGGGARGRTSSGSTAPDPDAAVAGLRESLDVRAAIVTPSTVSTRPVAGTGDRALRDGSRRDRPAGHAGLRRGGRRDRPAAPGRVDAAPLARMTAARVRRARAIELVASALLAILLGAAAGILTAALVVPGLVAVATERPRRGPVGLAAARCADDAVTLDLRAADRRRDGVRRRRRARAAAAGADPEPAVLARRRRSGAARCHRDHARRARHRQRRRSATRGSRPCPTTSRPLWGFAFGSSPTRATRWMRRPSGCSASRSWWSPSTCPRRTLRTITTDPSPRRIHHRLRRILRREGHVGRTARCPDRQRRADAGRSDTGGRRCDGLGGRRGAPSRVRRRPPEGRRSDRHLRAPSTPRTATGATCRSRWSPASGPTGSPRRSSAAGCFGAPEDLAGMDGSLADRRRRPPGTR